MSLVQIKVERNVFISYLYGYATFGPVKVFLWIVMGVSLEVIAVLPVLSSV